MKYIDADLLRERIGKNQYVIEPMFLKGDDSYYEGEYDGYNRILSIIDSLQQEQPNDLASLISEATNVAKRIIDRDSFYNSLPQNIRDKYTYKAWREILEALSTMKMQEQPEVDLEKEIETYFKGWYMDETDQGYILHTPDDHAGLMSVKQIARHFYELGLNTKEKNK